MLSEVVGENCSGQIYERKKRTMARHDLQQTTVLMYSLCTATHALEKDSSFLQNVLFMGQTPTYVYSVATF